MNFFGHAAVAADHFGRARPTPSSGELSRLCLGAMLPDFVTMLRLPRLQVQDVVLARGVAFHHLTDHYFHELHGFQGLSRQTFGWLSERGMPRGPARAVAHVGIEILLDEVMASDEQARSAYLGALGVTLGSALRLDPPGELERLEELRRALLERAVAHRVATPELVALRIRRTLAGRRRLATDDTGEELLRAWVEQARPAVAAAAPALLATLRAQLARQPGDE